MPITNRGSQVTAPAGMQASSSQNNIVVQYKYRGVKTASEKFLDLPGGGDLSWSDGGKSYPSFSSFVADEIRHLVCSSPLFFYWNDRRSLVVRLRNKIHFRFSCSSRTNRRIFSVMNGLMLLMYWLQNIGRCHYSANPRIIKVIFINSVPIYLCMYVSTL